MEKMRQNFTVKYSQNSFAINAENLEILEDKIHFFKNKSINVPCLLIIGNIHDIKEIFVLFYKIRYSFTSILRALDICFKIFFTFNLNYPKESETFWIFIEHFFYELNQSNVKPKIAVLSNEIQTG